MKYILCLFTAFLSHALYGQALEPEMKNKTNLAIYYVDSVLTNQSELAKLNPSDMASIKPYKGKYAQEKVGDKGKNGVVFIETKKFAQKRYWNYFKSKSSEYYKIVPTPGSDKFVQYIHNGRVLKSDFEGNLSDIDDNVFVQMDVMPKDTLLKWYGIYDKKYGVFIETKAFKNPVKENIIEIKDTSKNQQN